MKKVWRLSTNRMNNTINKPVSIHTVSTDQSLSTNNETQPEAVINPRKLIVVLGMHRSGTSAITRALKVLGVQLGDKLIPPMSGVNEKGFWENIDINAFDMELLQTIGSDWHCLSPVQTVDLQQLRSQGYYLRAIELLRQIIDNEKIFGIKDPRVAKLLPFWECIFKNQTEWKVCYVIALRNPLSVAKSLAKRDGFDFEKSFLLWLDHVISSLVYTTGEKRVLVDYDRLMQAPERELKRMADSLDLVIDESELQIYIDEFLDKGLQHSIYKPGDLLLEDSCPPLAQEIYITLIDILSGKITIEDEALEKQIAQWQKELDRLESPLRLMDKLYSQISIVAQSMSERDAQIGAMEEAITVRDGQISSLKQEAAESNGKIAHFDHVVAELHAQIETLKQAVSERDGQISSLKQEAAESNGKVARFYRIVAELHAQIETLKQAVSERDGQISELNQIIHALNSELSSILHSKSWKLTMPLRALRRYLSSLPHQFFRKNLSNFARWLWYILPLSNICKQRIKNALFKNLPIFLSWSKAYRDWQNFNAPVAKRLTQSFGLLEAPKLDVTLNSEYVPLLKGKPLKNKPSKLICFYLPQFHPIPENNAWWGNGFTEWTNVQPAEPQFDGHYQPHVPGELGYYSLLDSTIQRRQIELAKLYGIEGFCFYFYWFGGKRLLETPIQNYSKDKSLDFSFCLCWANENWSRRWDGLDSELLIAQQHSPEDDIAFIEHVSQYLCDPRYIRIDGKPLLLVYRPSLLPSARETTGRWRKWCRNHGIGEIYLAYTQSFETVDPAIYGFDAAIEFPPNNSSPPNVTDQVHPMHNDFSCTVYDWRIFVERSEKYKQPNYKLFRSVCTSWDNTPRRQNRSTIFLNSSPTLYERWLSNAINDTVKNHVNPNERLIFINAWNEWAEGAHLEPDQKFGYAWLQSTRDALINSSKATSNRKIIIVSHDAHPHGAQYLALHLVKVLSTDFNFHVDVALLGDGSLTTEFERWATVHKLADIDPKGSKAKLLAKKLVDSGHKSAIVNSTVSGLFLETLADSGIECTALVHELPNIINSYNLHEHTIAISNKAKKVVFPAQLVANSFPHIANISNDRLLIRPQGLYKRNRFRGRNELARIELRKELGITQNTRIVLGVGFGDFRKGIDIFVQSGLQQLQAHPNTYFVWVGKIDAKMQLLVDQQLASSNLSKHFLFTGHKNDTDVYYAGADIFALTSREDPFPSVVMESLEVGIPVIGFKGAGGFDTLLNKNCGILADKEDINSFSDALKQLLGNPQLVQELGKNGASIIEELFSFRHYIYDLLDISGVSVKRISAVVPNYNYARYIDLRLKSILNQTYPIYELIVLDDASTDNSIEIIESCFSNTNIDCRLIVNNKNSGSVFNQWMKATEYARGEFIWICEADDYAEPAFVEKIIDFFNDKDVVMGYSQSRQIDESGAILSNNYYDYTNDICNVKWQQDYICDGKEELANTLAIKNTIPNVSAVIFRKSVLYDAFINCRQDLLKLNIAGDWLIYSDLLLYGKIGHCAESLNSHRRHQKSVTISSSSYARHLAEIIHMQNRISKLINIDNDIVMKAKNYVKKIYAQFELDKSGITEPVKHPEIKSSLESLQ